MTFPCILGPCDIQEVIIDQVRDDEKGQVR